MTESDMLQDYYEMNFILIKEHGFSLTELENMLPYERDIYIFALLNYIEQKQMQERN